MKEYSQIQSLRTALRVLEALTQFRRSVPLSQLASECGLSQSKLHRYLATLADRQYVSQDAKTSEYSLGGGAIRLGLAALKQVDLFTRVNNELEALAARIGQHVFMTIWTTAGPVVIRWAFSNDRLAVHTMPGQVLPVTRSSAGQLYAAFLPRAFTQDLIDRELAAIGTEGDYARKLLDRIQAVAEHKFSRSVGESESHLLAVSVPVFDWHQNWIVTVGCVFDLATAPEAVNAKLDILRGFAERLSITPALNLTVVA